MSVVKVSKNFQITLPVKVRNEVHIKEGDIMEVEVIEDGILLKPKEIIDRAQAWFWTKEWQEEEKKV
jgi:AbrB family looped-hinge helix DNA binding protein